jgi:predicted MFS family arabinose efflux permease
LRLPARSVGPVAVLATGTFAIGTDGFVVAGILPGIAHGLHATVATTGLVVTAFAVTYAVGAPLLTSATARMERRRLLVVAMTVLAVANLGAAAAPTFGLLMAARVLAAVAGGLYSPVALATAVRLTPDAERGRAVAAVLAGLTVSLVVGVPLGSVLADLGTWRWTFAFVAAVALGVAGGLRLILPPIPAGAVSSLSSRVRLLRRPAVVANLVAALVWITGAFTLYTFVVPVLHAGTGWNEAGISGLLVVYGLAAIAGNTLGGHAADRWGAKPSITIALASLVVTLSALGWAAGEGPPIGLPVSIVAVAAWAMAGWSLTPSLAHRLVALTPGAGPEVLSLNTSAIYLGIAAGAAVGGPVLADLGVAQLGYTAAALQLLALAIVISAPSGPPTRRSAPSEIQNEPTLVSTR